MRTPSTPVLTDVLRQSAVTLFLVLTTLLFSVATRAQSSADYTATPSQGSTTSTPQVLFALSYDHELFRRAYSDYSDIDGDGQMETSYKDSIDYYGYFESGTCYLYSANRFQPVWDATGDNGHSCTTAVAPWSGNFLNWATMTRMDLIRKVLYGGKRVTDTTTLTTLERAEIPYDFHAFSKIYEGSDVNEFTPYSSSAVTLCNLSQSEATPPLVRVRTGSHPDWAGSDQTRCQGSSEADHNVLVDVCQTGSADPACQQYSNSMKPTGLIQGYQDKVDFGLITGSFDSNVQGGVLRKNISSSSDEIDQTTGQFNLADGIVATVDAFRVSEYSYVNKKYECGGTDLVACRDWGNPISEIYMEALRYFAGRTTPSSDYSVGSDLGLPKPSWQDPLNTSNRCASNAIILLSTGQNSFDGDDFPSIHDLLPGGISQLNTLTNDVGNSEDSLSFPGNFLVGSNGGSQLKQCEPKFLSGLSQARGICPEIPEYEGSYYAAGLAHFARINDLRSTLDGIQNIDTYAVELAQSTPSLSFTVQNSGEDRTVTVAPICQTINYADKGDESKYTPCRYLDLVVDNSSVTYANGSLTGLSFTISWGDEPFGGDGDADMSARYTIQTSNNNISVRIHDPVDNGANSYRVGYSISGVSGHSGMVMDADYNANYVGTLGSYDDGDSESALLVYNGAGTVSTTWQCNGAPDCVYATPEDVSKQFTPSGSNSSVELPKPLLLAAKYGGFTDLDNDGTPSHDNNQDGQPDDDSREWDSRNNLTGALGADGIPDNYFFPNNPALLEQQLGQILKEISGRVSSGSSAALVTNSSSGSGSIIQGLFQPKVTGGNLEISWVGLLHSLFVDKKGRFREDSNGNRTLDDYATDRAVSLFFDPISNSTIVQRYSSDDNGDTLTADGNTVDLAELNPVWSAHKQLMELTNPTQQRSYSASADNGRYIFTWTDPNFDGRVDNNETAPFVAATFSGNSSGLLGLAETESAKLVNYVRGEEQSGYRSRTLDHDSDGDTEVWRLGDIIGSSPTAVAEPIGFYSEERPYNSTDSTFIEFQQHYRNRRQVVYAGANDGLLHAFNAGFWNEQQQRFDLSANGETEHPLGSELWAYAPLNLLPHLRWLAEPSYPHVYYMDGEPLIFDANIFTPDSDHPKGWGTVLVAGMRLGGGPIESSVGDIPRTHRSALIVLDITNPEQPPKLLAEITHPELGFTTSRPVVIQRRTPSSSGDYNSPIQNDWYIAFGSGPTGTGQSGIRDALDDATSDQNLKVFVYDLRSNGFVTGFNPYDSGISNAYAGDMTAVDWNQDFYDDTVYFGSVETTGDLSGRLLRLNMEDPNPANWTLGTLTNPARPIVARPRAISNSDNERWLFVGTGRESSLSDSDSSEQEYFVAVKETQLGGNFNHGTVSFSDLVDTTDIQIRANGDLVTSLPLGESSVDSFDGLKKVLADQPGWINRLTHNNIHPSGKSINEATTVYSLLLFTEYLPPADQCVVDGTSFLHALHYQTGTAIPASLQQVLTADDYTETTISTRTVSIGSGLAGTPLIHKNADGQTSIIVQGGTGSIASADLSYSLTDDGRQSWRQIFAIPR